MTRSTKKARAFVLIVLWLILYSLAGSNCAHAEDPSYNYSYWGDTVASPAAYLATTLLDGEKLGTGPLKEPSDIHVSGDQQVYIMDSGNNRIIITDSNFELITVVDSFEHDGKTDCFLNPQGLYVTEDKHVYVADTDNGRVVHLDNNFNLINIIESPESEMLHETFVFRPARVVVDKAKRVYVMSIGVFDGFMEFNADGTFTTFIGANRVYVDPVEYFWKLVATREQRSQMVQFTPTEFTNLDIDQDGFIYATNADQYGDNIKKLNAQGTDILRRDGYIKPCGDIRYTVVDGPSRLVDIDVADCEIYSVLDSKRGRIFTYNSDGYLLYIFGGLGNRLGEFNMPKAIERLGDNFLVLDKAFGEITVFEPTEYGRTLNEAVRSYYRGEEEKAFELFAKTANLNANFEYAYSGIGKSLLRQNKYKEAADFFREGMDRKNYSKAFLLYRREVMRDYFPKVMTGFAVLVLGILLLRVFAGRTRKRRKGGFSY
ncbi:MAG: hypothetical protein ACM3XR_03900 [Bacillota bacterium]